MQGLQRAVLRGSHGIGLRHATKRRSLNGICRVWFELAQSVTLGLFTGFSHRLSKRHMPHLGFLAFKEHRNRVVGVLIGHRHCIGWCVVRWQAVRQEKILTWHHMMTARTAQYFSSLTYHV